ncbi:MAG: hypothetical protein KGZ79_11275 [Dethiobacter sp.]|jgi:hypothetical protein|nr:hypothetical protein [Dethiobacter sp.]
MPGIKFLYITSEGKVYTIPTPNDSTYKAIPELGNSSVLMVNLYYETKNRKPWRLIRVGFDRIQLEEHGQYVLTTQERHDKFYNFNMFGFMTVEELSKGDEPLPIPKAPDIPTAKEKIALINFIRSKYPALWENSPLAVEKAIEFNINAHSKLINMVKEANLKRRKNSNI